MGAVPRVLSIAGSDPSGGAGIQADLKSIAAMGGYGMCAITALTAQNTRGVTAVHTPPADFLAAQLEAVGSDIQVDAVKIGMLSDAAVVRTVAAWLEQTRPAVVVLDPVMVATSGDRLLAADAEEALRGLLAHAHLVTPNLPELGALLGEATASTWNEALEQGRRLSERTGGAVLVKGGHLEGAACPDAIVDARRGADAVLVQIEGERVSTRNTHGTGCSLSSALATVQARTGDWARSLAVVKEWLRGALTASGDLEVGGGHGPVHHFHHLAASVPLAEGEFTDGLWRDTAKVRAEIDALPFIAQLDDGTLSQTHFAYYLTQDALYLNGYSRVLARASALAPTEEEQAFWAEGARVCLEVEAELHRTWLSRHPVPAHDAGGPGAATGGAGGAVPGPVTKAYVDHLLAASASGSYAVLAAAALPCYWIYAEVGAALHARHAARPEREGHPYGAWIGTYADEAFAEATRRAIAYTDAAGRRASVTERAAMREAFTASAVYEREFFDAPRRFA
ncbi:hydroxymethylpyrimidine/phosphomethylpyrimidine kinase [Sinomonas atrocyanea]|uniref:bifunctional hydroxymethylpyrimidine kinase/phosphomethylpyrimidine kinase n=1 Tax=Sinomonas atrocyanea TaxID=37927 RepID=UPI00278741BB|nr:bifunctional hydroxymethylpyrimidine kinase/phosphomethylpyrimidine kinase [Sinomonas atrocyanea]MDP9883845.1 hydroxymethylpyrimidine/phosphomethylpyrimidine kinase [Sinomonas atrocyanea]